MQLRLSAMLVAVGAVAALNGCGDPTSISARFDNIDTTRTVYALNGTPPNLPVAMLVRGAAPVRISASFDFDIAFDINPAGEVVVHPVRKLASQTAATHRVGMQLTTDQFDQVLEAPRTGYEYDSTKVLPMGQTMLIDVIDPACSIQSILGPNIRAKMVLDSVDLTRRAIYLHVLANPNCGFKSLVKGEPKD